jgi:hypothetical protein
MSEKSEFDARPSLPVHPCLPKHYIAKDPQLVEPWIQGGKYESLGMAIGCACYGDVVMEDELRWVGEQMGDQVNNLVVAVDPGVLSAADQWKPVMERLAGSPDWINNTLTDVCMVPAYSGNLDLLETLKDKIEKVLIVAPEPSDAAGIIGDALLYAKPDGVVTVVLLHHQYSRLADCETNTGEQILQKLTRGFVNKGHTLRPMFNYNNMDISPSFLSKEKYLKAGYPSGMQISSSTIPGNNILILEIQLKSETNN